MRLVIFTDLNNFTTTALIRATLRSVDRRDDFELCGFVTSRPDRFRRHRWRNLRRFVRRLAVAAANLGTPARLTHLARRTRIDLFQVARARAIPVLTPPPAGINDPVFVAEVLGATGADVALSYYCTQIWKRELLGAFDHAVNYHDGFLPWYKGVAATSFSLYHGEPTTGFTFHRMTEGIDAGPILVQGSVTTGDHTMFAEADRRKVAAGVAALPRVLDLIAAGDPGTPQTDAGSYFSGRDLRDVFNVRSPSGLTTTELQRRIRAFGSVRVTIDGVEWPVTRVRPGRPGDAFTFVTADGSYCTADRIRGLPARFARTPRRAHAPA